MANDRHWVRPGLVLPGGELQGHGRLALEADHRRQPHQRRHRVEQPPHAAGARGVYRPAQHRQQRIELPPAEPLPGDLGRRRTEDLEQQPQGRSAGLAHRPVAAGQGERAQVGHPLKLRPLAPQNLAAPDRPVRPVARPVPRKPQHRPLQAHPIRAFCALLGHTGGHVGVVVLHANQRNAPRRGQLLGVPRGGVVGVQVAGHRLGHRLEEIHQVGDHLPVYLDAGHVVQVADVRAEDHLGAERQGHGVLQVPAHRQDRGDLKAQVDRQRGKAAGAAQHLQAVGADPGDRIIDRADNRPVVRQEHVGDGTQALQRVGRADRHGLLGEIAARADDRPAGGFQEQMVQRRVGQHHAQVRVARRHVLGNGDRGRAGGGSMRRPSPQQQDRRLVRSQRLGLLLRDLAIPPDFLQRPEHDGQRFVGPPLAPAQQGHRLGVGGVAEELEPTQPLDRYDPAGPHRFGGAGQGTVGLGQARAGGVHQPQRRPARRTGDRLGVEPPVGRVLVFGPALGTHREAGHRGPRPVVGQLPDDRPPRPAVGAVGERVAEPALAGRADLFPALGTGSQVGRDGRPGRRLPAACADLERPLPVPARGLGNLQPIDPCLGRVRLAQGLQKRLEPAPFPLDLDPHRVGLVGHPAAQSPRPGGIVDERPKPHPLHHPAHRDRQAADRSTCTIGGVHGRFQELFHADHSTLASVYSNSDVKARAPRGTDGGGSRTPGLGQFNTPNGYGIIRGLWCTNSGAAITIPQRGLILRCRRSSGTSKTSTAFRRSGAASSGSLAGCTRYNSVRVPRLPTRQKSLSNKGYAKPSRWATSGWADSRRLRGICFPTRWPPICHRGWSPRTVPRCTSIRRPRRGESSLTRSSQRFVAGPGYPMAASFGQRGRLPGHTFPTTQPR